MTSSDNTPPPGPPAMPLAAVGIGEEVTLAAITGRKKLQHRLAEMGLTPGVRLTVLNKGTPGPFIILVKETRLVLGLSMIHSVRVRAVD